MKPHLPPLRKAAILLASLDDETADGLMGQMEPEHAARVRREMIDLGEIDSDVQRQVLAEFRRGSAPPRDPYPAGIELDSGLAEKIARSEPLLPCEAPRPPAEEPPPFRFLHEAEADTLVDYLKNERPQTIAVVVSHLSPSQAVEVVDRLAPAVQAQVLRRLAELDETDPAILRDVERYLESWISEQVRSRERRQAGLQALGAILSAAGRTTRQQIIANLTRHDSSLAETLGFDVPSSAAGSVKATAGNTQASSALRETPSEISFEELMRIGDRRLIQLIEAAKPDVLVLALAGANAAFVERVMSCLSARQARTLRRALKHLGPTRLSDVEEAQQTLADLAAGHYRRDGEQSELPARVRVAAVAA